MRIEEKIWSCYDEVASTALRHGYLNIADSMFSASLEEAQRSQSDLALIARSCFGLAATYQQRGLAREAMYYYRKAIMGFEKGNDSNLNWLASSCENLAILHIAEGALARARSLLRRALSIYQKLLGESHPVLIPAMVVTADTSKAVREILATASRKGISVCKTERESAVRILDFGMTNSVFQASGQSCCLAMIEFLNAERDVITNLPIRLAAKLSL
ncbi:unnamed protein product [Sphagnum balticum]